MSNSFYTHGSFPSTGSAATSASMRAELDLITVGFDKLPALSSGVANQLVAINSSGTGLTTITTLPTLTVNDSAFTVQDNADNTRKFQFQASGITAGVTRTFTMPDATTTLVGTDNTQTLTNKTLTSPTISGGSIDNATIGATTPSSGVFNAITNTNLTSGRVVYSSTSGLETDSANLTFDGTTLTSIGLAATGNTTLGNATADTVTVNGTITSNLIFTDNTYDIGASGVTRPRNLFLAGNATVAGNTTLGDATTDTVTVNGYMGVGGAGGSTRGISVVSTALTGTSQYGLTSQITSTSSATSATVGFYAGVSTAASAYTSSAVRGFWVDDATKGAGSTITNQHGVYISDQTQGTNNYGITSLVSSGTNKFNIYASGTADNYFAGNVGIGTSAPVSLLTVEGSLDNSAITGSSTPFGIVVDNASTVANSYSQINLLNGGLPTAQNDGWAIRSLYQANNDCDLSFNFLSNAGGTPIGSEKMRIDSSGNVGIGVTPSAWSSTLKPIEIGNIGTYVAGRPSGNQIDIGVNNYYNAGYKYANTGVAATQYEQTAGTHAWYYAASGTAGNTITFAQAMTLNASGNLGIGASAPDTRLEVAGSNNSTWSATLTSISGTTMTVSVSATVTGTIAVGDLVYASGIQPYTRVTALGTGTGGVGTYTVSVSQTVASTTVVGGATYSSTLIRITETDSAVSAGQPTGGLQFYTSDATAPTAGVGAYVAAVSEDTSPDTALVFGTRDDAGGGIDANERMRLDSAGNLGIGTTAPETKLHIKSASTSLYSTVIAANKSLTGFGTVNYTATDISTDGTFAASQWLVTRNTGVEQYAYMGAVANSAGFSPDIVFGQRTASTVMTERMRIDSSGNVGIGGTSAGEKLEVVGSIQASGGASSFNRSGLILDYQTGSSLGRIAVGPAAGGTLAFYTGNGATVPERMRIDDAGNVGVGVTPSAWVGNTAMQVGPLGAISSSTTVPVTIASNAFSTSAGWAAKYITTSFAAAYQQVSGQHLWYTAPSGTAGNAITFTQAMTLSAAGNLGIGTTTPVAKLEIAGDNTSVWTNTTTSISGTTMTVVGTVTGGTIAVGDLIFASAIQPYTRVTALGTGTGGAGTYTVSVSQTFASAAIFGTSAYGNTLIRITDTDTTQAGGQPNGALQFYTSDASSPTAGVGAYVAGLAEQSTPDTALVFGTRDASGGGIDANERMRIDSVGNVGIGVTSPLAYLSLKNAATADKANSIRLFDAGGTNGNNYGFGMNNSTGEFSYTAGTAGFHTWYTVNTERLRITSQGSFTFTTADLTGANPTAVGFNVTAKAANTGNTSGVLSTYNTDATYTGAGSIIGFYASQGTFTVAPANQYGFYYVSSNTGATNNYAYTSTMVSAVGRYNIYMSGTADNYLAGYTYVKNVLWQYAPAPTSKAALATLTAAELQTGILNTTGTTYTITLPTGTAIDTGFTNVAFTDVGFDWYVVNTASGIITIAQGATGMTTLGSLTVAIGASAHFRLRRTAANTYVLYRLS